MNRAIYRYVAMALVAALVTMSAEGFTLTSPPAPQGLARAEQVTGKFVSFQPGSGSGTLTVDATRGGQRTFIVNDGVPMIVFPDKNHPKTISSPDGFTYGAAGMSILMTLDTNEHIVQITLGGATPGKGGKKKK